VAALKIPDSLMEEGGRFGIRHGPLGPLSGVQVSAVDATNADLADDGLGSRLALGNILRRCREDLKLLAEEADGRGEPFLVAREREWDNGGR